MAENLSELTERIGKLENVSARQEGKLSVIETTVNRIDEHLNKLFEQRGFDRRDGRPAQNGSDWKVIAFFVTLLLGIGGLLQQQISFMQATNDSRIYAITNILQKVDERMTANNDRERINRGEFAALKAESSDVATDLENLHEEVQRIRDWKDKTEADIPTLYEKIEHANDVMKISTSDRYRRHEAEKDFANMKDLIIKEAI